MSKTDIVPALLGFAEDWRRHLSKRQSQWNVAGFMMEDLGGGGEPCRASSPDLRDQGNLLEAMITKLRPEKWVRMAKRRRSKVRVVLQRQPLEKILRVRQNTWARCWRAYLRESVWEMHQILSSLFLELFDTPPFLLPSVKYVSIFIYQWKGGWLEKSSHLVFTSSSAV